MKLPGQQFLNVAHKQAFQHAIVYRHHSSAILFLQITNRYDTEISSPCITLVLCEYDGIIQILVILILVIVFLVILGFILQKTVGILVNI